MPHSAPKAVTPDGKRTSSDRYTSGDPAARPVLIKNATIWTGNARGTEILERADILLEHGLVKAIGSVDSALLDAYDGDYGTVDARGSWITPGIVDLHSHVGVEPAPALSGAADGNSFLGPTQPWLRAVDGLNTHDEGYRLAVAGGVTTSLVLPGSADAIGGQGILMKLRPTKERSPTSMLLEPPFTLNGTAVDSNTPPRWRHMKHACGENPAGSYGQTRMDTTWQWRQIYDKARQIKNAQDEYCAHALKGEWESVEGRQFPEELAYEALVDVLRGKVKVQTHCYEAVDFDEFVRLSNEFKFPIAAFHHAHEAWLVPDLLKSAYEHPPAVAMFASFSRYKREAYRHSEFAPRVLADEDLDVVMKSDTPGIVSRYLMHEAQQAHYYGLAANLALASVISTPSKVLGIDHRIGYLRAGYDADLVVWDAHPLQIGATPFQVFIDGIPQLPAPHLSPKPASHQHQPSPPNFDAERAQAVRYEGLPPLTPRALESAVIFGNVSRVWTRRGGKVAPLFEPQSLATATVVVRGGKIVCTGLSATDACAHYTGAHTIDLRGGELAPALVSAGGPLGLQEIMQEPSTTDGAPLDLLKGNAPKIMGAAPVARAADGVMAHTRDALLAWRAGVTRSVTAPLTEGSTLVQGLSVYLDLGAAAGKAVLREVAALHVELTYGSGVSVSTQVAALRRILKGEVSGELGRWAKEVTSGRMPLVVSVVSADIISTLLLLKEEVEASSGHRMQMTLMGATEAHLLAKELAAANVGVIVTPPRQFPYTWERRRILPGPPLSSDSVVTRLFAHNVTVGIGHQGIYGMQVMNGWAARNARWDAAWVALESGGLISAKDAIEMLSTNIEKLLGVESDDEGDLVATEGGGLLDFEGKVVAIVSPRLGQVAVL